MGDDLAKVAPRRGLAARQMHLQHPQCGSLGEYAPPCRGVEFVGALFEFERIGTIRAAQGTDMRQFGEQAERRLDGRRRARRVVHSATLPLAERSASSARTSASMRARSPL